MNVNKIVCNEMLNLINEVIQSRSYVIRTMPSDCDFLGFSVNGVPKRK